MFLHMSKGKPYAEEKHIAGTHPDTMAVLVWVFRGQPPARPCSCLIIKANTDMFPMLGALGGQGQCSWHGFCLGAVAAPWFQDSGAQHFCSAFGLPGGSYQLYLFIGLFVFFVLIYPLPS